MIEFAIVLIIKLKLKWDAANAGEDIFSSNETVQNMNQRIYNPPFFNESRRRVSIKSKTEHANKDQDRDLSRQRKGIFDSLQTTTKIDLLAFIVFASCYFMFNCFYWQHFGMK